MKSYTNIEQSKKLAKILSTESADMCFVNDGTSIKIDANPYNVRKYMWKDVQLIPCWSLAALLEKIPDTIINNVDEDLKLHIDKDGFQYSLFYENEYTGNMFEIETKLYDDMIDACYEMIIKLSKQKLL